ncbi:MAG: hypothetical protein ACFFC6_05165 [Promethearchaeota archaeon]
MNTISITTEFILPGKGKTRHNEMQQFAQYLMTIQSLIDFKLSSRGWCYQLEGLNAIHKGEFRRVQKLINTCRKQGYLPINFVAEDEGRKLQGDFPITEASPEEFLFQKIDEVREVYRYYRSDYWESFDYYLIMLVEKVDLITLFEPICKEYNLKIANAKGWSSILQRAMIAEEFRMHEKEYNQQPVLLYFGDLDPYGLAISDQIRKNFNDIKIGTGWNPHNLMINRFGLNIEFVKQHQLTWIDNLYTGSGKKADRMNPIVAKYIEQYGVRKVEANAVVAKPNEARKLCRETIEYYLGKDALKIITQMQDEEYYYFTKLLTNTHIDELMKTAQETLETGKK